MDIKSINQKLAVNGGDFAKLTPEERGLYYTEVCESVGVNPLTEPFKYLELKGKLQLYATRACGEQLRKVHTISLVLSEGKFIDNIYTIKAKASMPSGRTDESSGAVSLAGLKGEDLANAMLKAETKAKRRVTLSICGLGYLDETEVETIPDAILIDAKHEKPTESKAKPEAKPEEKTPKPSEEQEPTTKKEPAKPAKKETAKKEKKPKSEKLLELTVAVMDAPVATDGGFDIKVVVTLPEDIAESTGYEILTMRSETSYPEGATLQVKGTINGNEITAEEILPMVPTEIVTLTSDPTVMKNGGVFAYVECDRNDEGTYALIGDISEYKPGDQLQVVIASETKKGKGVILTASQVTPLKIAV